MLGVSDHRRRLRLVLDDGLRLGRQRRRAKNFSGNRSEPRNLGGVGKRDEVVVESLRPVEADPDVVVVVVEAERGRRLAEQILEKMGRGRQLSVNFLLELRT